MRPLADTDFHRVKEVSAIHHRAAININGLAGY